MNLQGSMVALSSAIQWKVVHCQDSPVHEITSYLNLLPTTPSNVNHIQSQSLKRGKPPTRLVEKKYKLRNYNSKKAWSLVSNVSVGLSSFQEKKKKIFIFSSGFFFKFSLRQQQVVKAHLTGCHSGDVAVFSVICYLLKRIPTKFVF